MVKKIDYTTSKKDVAYLEKCYALTTLIYKNKPHYLVASEVVNQCMLFSQKGDLVSTIWDAPGGTMSMEQIPNTDGEFLAIQEFYGPDNSLNSKIVYVKPNKEKWDIKTLVHLPHVHRFGIITINNKNYLVAATLKSGHQHEGDWSSPGKVYVGELPTDLDNACENQTLDLYPLIENLLRNHGFYKDDKRILIGSAEGIHEITFTNNDWKYKLIYDVETSDMWPLDIDSDGVEELLILAPFHGPELSILKRHDGKYKTHYLHQEPLPFLHAIWGGDLNGTNCFIVGNREGNQELFMITHNGHEYNLEIIDSYVGPANVLHINEGGKDYIISANRETDIINSYLIERSDN